MIALHGLAENTEYWRATGLADRISERYSFVGFDLRGHGRTQHTAGPERFDVETIAADIGSVADGLGLDRFHLLAHATGGMGAAAYAFEHPDRVLSLMMTSSSTASGVLGPPDDADARAAAVEGFATFFESGDWPVLFERMAAAPGPFLFMVDAHPDAERLWSVVRHIFSLGEPATLGRFIRSCYVDPDPRLEELASLTCPILVLCGEHDPLMRPWVDVMAGGAPHTTKVILDGVGHMTAIEAPGRTATAILDFLASTGGRRLPDVEHR